MLDQPLSERLRAAREAEAEAQEAPEAEPTTPSATEPRRRLPLGQLLVEKGVLSESDLTIALAHQRADGRPLGQILLDMGVVTQSDLARTLTEQHGFDSSASLRRRLGAVDEGEPEEAPVDTTAEAPRDESYVVREPTGEPLHVSDSFLDAADAAFELIEERDPEQLEIVRAREGEFEHLWAYRRDDAAGAEPGGAA